jgi:SagB-type dehydrogenase family enzyme
MAAALVGLAASTTRPVEPLPPAATTGSTSLEEVLAKRRSVRRFESTPLTQQQIGQLCWAAQGVTDPKRGLRTAPSAGALYPLELYVATAEGVDRYVPATHSLERHLDGDVRSALQGASLGQPWVGQAPAVFVISAAVHRLERKYGERSARYAHLEAGHAGQNLLLQAVALDLGAVPVGAYNDEQVAQALQLPAEQTPLYLIPVGQPSR